MAKLTSVDADTGRFLRTTGAPRGFARLQLSEMDATGNEERFARVREVGAKLSTWPTVEWFPLLLTGAFGVGKTRIATWLLRKAFEAWGPRAQEGPRFPRFFSAADLANLRFKSFAAEDEEDQRDLLRDALEHSPVLVIDDVGRISGYKGEELYLESVVERRFNAERTTILTLNEVPAEGRFADFLAYFEEIALAGDSRRTGV